MARGYVITGVIIGAFVAGIGLGYVIFMAAYSPYQAVPQGPAFYSMMSGNPQFAGQYMSYMMQNPQRQQMYGYMLQNRDFMYGMMGNPSFQNQYMGPWMMQNPQFQRQWSHQASPGGLNGTQVPAFTGQPAPGSYMGPGMMYGGQGQQLGTIPISEARSMAGLPPLAQKFTQNNTLAFSSQVADIVALSFSGYDARNFTGTAAPQYAKDDAFVIGGMIDPTITVNRGTTLNVTSVNLDEDMAHNFAIMTSPPPYPYMAMQGMMYGGMVATMPVLPNDDPGKGMAYEYSYAVTLSNPGTYWYVCTYPGHAQDGMYGKIIVR